MQSLPKGHSLVSPPTFEETDISLAVRTLIHLLVIQDIDSGLLRVKQPVVLTLQPVEVGFETVNGGIAVPEILRVALEVLTRFNELIHVR